MRTNRFVVPFLIFALSALCSTSAQESSTLQGVWRVVEVRMIRPDGSATIIQPQESLALFATGYYSMYWTSHQPSNHSWQVADSEKIARFNASLFNGGTYKISGSVLETRADVAQVPMFTSGSATFRMAFSADTLVLTGINVVSVDGVQHPLYAGGGHVVNKLVKAR